MENKRSKVWCSAKKCTNTPRKTPNLHFYRFPKEKQRSTRWVQSTGRDDLLEKSLEYRNKNCRICSSHFEPSQILCTGRLVWNAVPTIFSFPSATKAKQDPQKCKLPCEHDARDRITPTCRFSRRKAEPASKVLVEHVDHDYVSTQLKSPPEKPCRSDPVEREDSVPDSTSTKSTQCPEGSPDPSKTERKKSANSSKTRVQIHRLRKKIKTLEESLKKSSRSKSVQGIISNASKYLEKTALDFFASQLRIGNKRLKGRRYSTHDKLTAFALHSQSSVAYKFFRKVFALPHERSLRKWLARVKGQPDFDQTAFDLIVKEAQL